MARIALVTFAADTSKVSEFNTIRDLVYPQRSRYCTIHEYEHWYHHGTNYSVGYYAVQRLQYILNRFVKNEADAAWVLNLAAVITNLAIPVTRYMSGNGLCIVKDRNGLNAGSMIIHNNDIMISWLSCVIDAALKTKHPWHEQHIIQELEYSYWPYTILQSPSINQYKHKLYGWPEGEAQDWKPGDFVIHFPGRPLKERIDLVKWALKRVM